MHLKERESDESGSFARVSNRAAVAAQDPKNAEVFLDLKLPLVASEAKVTS